MTLRRIWTLATASMLALAVAAPVAAGPRPADAVERARDVAQHTAEKVRGKSASAPGRLKDKPAQRGAAEDDGKLRGRERAAAAIAAALARGNGEGNAFGRGHALRVHEILLAGGSPSEIAGEHGAAVSALVKAYNAMKAKRAALG